MKRNINKSTLYTLNKNTLYRENTLPYSTVARWVSYFKEGRSIVKDEAHPGRSVSATSENDVATVQSIVQHICWKR